MKHKLLILSLSALFLSFTVTTISPTIKVMAVIYEDFDYNIPEPKNINHGIISSE